MSVAMKTAFEMVPPQKRALEAHIERSAVEDDGPRCPLSRDPDFDRPSERLPHPRAGGQTERQTPLRVVPLHQDPHPVPFPEGEGPAVVFVK